MILYVKKHQILQKISNLLLYDKYLTCLTVIRGQYHYLKSFDVTVFIT
jgi:hypothetical protein